jgi:hypothetical protein
MRNKSIYPSLALAINIASISTIILNSIVRAGLPDEDLFEFGNSVI